MQVELPSGGKATLRSKLKAKDKFAVQAVITFSRAGDITGSIVSLMETTLMARLIEDWSLDSPLPSSHSCPECTGNSAKWHEHVRDEFGEVLDLDDYNALETAVGPALQQVMQAPNLGTPSA